MSKDFDLQWAMENCCCMSENESDLISKTRLLYFLVNVPSDINKELTCTTDVLSGCAFRNNEILSFVNDMPTVDTEKHGHWELKRRITDTNWFACSVCGRISEIKMGLKTTPYCSMCGAKMDEVTDDE